MTVMQTHTVELTRLQRAVLDELCASGAGNAQLAKNLGLSLNTVKVHLTKIYGAFGVSNDRELLARMLNGHVQLTTRKRRSPVRPPRAPKLAPPKAPEPQPEPQTPPRELPVHSAPRPGHVLQATRCCHRLTGDLPPRHRITSNPDAVTCQGRK